MKFFRPRIKVPKFKTKRQFAKAFGVAVFLTVMIAVISKTNFDSQAFSYNTSPNWDQASNSWRTSGDWHNCDGSIDNDPAHHSFDINDTDPAHHMGMICKGPKEAWSVNAAGSADKNIDSPQVTANILAAEVINPVSGPPMSSAQDSITDKVQTAVQTITTSTTGSSNNNPFAGQKLYVNSNNDPSNYVRNNQGSYNAIMMQKIAKQPEVEWLGGWNWNITGDVSTMMNNINAQGALPVFVVYNIPDRDCGGYSSGGVSDSSSYNNWISQIANTIGNRKAVVILEPDAITLTDCLSQNQKSDRYQMLRNAITQFKSKGQISVYIDAGHPNWLSANDVAERLKQAGVDQADGFALNIANFYTNDQNASYGKQISDLIGGKHFIVDTGRNGSGGTSDNQWCNPSGRSLGTPPTTSTGNSLIDAYLWVKGPGGSDGNCNGGPSAGTFWPDYALGLAQRTNW